MPDSTPATAAHFPGEAAHRLPCPRADKRHLAAVYYSRPLRYLGFRKWFWVGCWEVPRGLRKGGGRSMSATDPTTTAAAIVAKVPDEPGKVWFQVEVVPFWPGANGEDWHTGTLDAADVAQTLRDIADRCERYWNAEAVERPNAE